MTGYPDELLRERGDWWRGKVCEGCKRRRWDVNSLEWINFWIKGVFHQELLCPPCARKREGPPLPYYLDQREGSGETADELPYNFNVQALRLASHQPEPDGEDDTPGWGLAAHLGTFLYPTLSDAIEGVSSAAQELRGFGRNKLRRKGGAVSPW